MGMDWPLSRDEKRIKISSLTRCPGKEACMLADVNSDEHPVRLHYQGDSRDPADPRNPRSTRSWSAKLTLWLIRLQGYATALDLHKMMCSVTRILDKLDKVIIPKVLIRRVAPWNGVL